jgi:hypothetical protein
MTAAVVGDKPWTSVLESMLSDALFWTMSYLNNEW